MAPEPVEEDIVRLMAEARREEGIDIDALTSMPSWDGLFPPDYDWIISTLAREHDDAVRRPHERVA